MQQVSYALTLFHHRFERLRSLDLTPGGLTINNNYEGHLNGVEGWGQWRLAEHLRLHAGFTHQRLSAHALPGTAPLQGVSSLGNDPRHRASLGLAWDLGRR